MGRDQCSLWLHIPVGSLIHSSSLLVTPVNRTGFPASGKEDTSCLARQQCAGFLHKFFDECYYGHIHKSSSLSPTFPLA